MVQRRDGPRSRRGDLSAAGGFVQAAFLAASRPVLGTAIPAARDSGRCNNLETGRIPAVRVCDDGRVRNHQAADQRSSLR